MNLHADGPNLATSSTGIEDAVKSANAVIICRFISLGTPDVGPPGETVYQGAIVEVSSKLKGAAAKRISCSFRVTTFPPEKRETLPQIGSAYVIAGSPTGGDFEIGKVLSATPDNVALVRSIIDNKPVPKSRDSEPKQTGKVPLTTGITREQVTEPLAPVPNPKTPKQLLSSDEPTSSTPWSFIVVLIAAATGLLWLLLKRRS